MLLGNKSNGPRFAGRHRLRSPYSADEIYVVGAGQNVSYRNRTLSGASLDLNRPLHRGVLRRQGATIGNGGDGAKNNNEHLYLDTTGGDITPWSPPSPIEETEKEFSIYVPSLPITTAAGEHDDNPRKSNADDVQL